jgi:hypothetical protein
MKSWFESLRCNELIQPNPRRPVASGEDAARTEELNITRDDATLVVSYKGVKEFTLPPESDVKFFRRDSGREVVFSFEDNTTTMDPGGEQQAVRHRAP